MKTIEMKVSIKGNKVLMKEFISLDEAYKLAGYATREGIYRAVRAEKVNQYMTLDMKTAIYKKSEILELKKERQK